jgi:hypothetical protein
MRPFTVRWLVPLTLVVLLLPACSDSGDEAANATLAPTTTAAAVTTTTAPTTTVAPATTTTTTTVPESVVALPGPGEPWDLLFFGFDDVFTQQPAELYGALAADELGVDVRTVQPAGFSHVWAATLLARLYGTVYPPLGEYVPPAEIIVLFSRPGEALDGFDDYIVEDFERCWWRPLEGEPPETDLPADYWDRFRSDLDEVYTELWRLRESTPTVMRTIDLYNPSLPQQRDGGIEAECTAWFESLSTQMAEAATEHGSTFVSLYDLFNGPNHDLDPAEVGYIGPTDLDPGAPWYRSTETGSELIAERLAEEGFEPTPQS